MSPVTCRLVDPASIFYGTRVPRAGIRNRTGNLRITSAPLCRLSHAGAPARAGESLLRRLADTLCRIFLPTDRFYMRKFSKRTIPAFRMKSFFGNARRLSVRCVRSPQFLKQFVRFFKPSELFLTLLIIARPDSRRKAAGPVFGSFRKKSPASQPFFNRFSPLPARPPAFSARFRHIPFAAAAPRSLDGRARSPFPLPFPPFRMARAAASFFKSERRLPSPLSASGARRAGRNRKKI